MSDALDNAIWAINSAQTRVQIPRPTGQLRLVLTGTLPVSSTDSTNMLAALVQGEAVLFRCAAAVSWQGQSSMADPKHNFKLKLSNETSGDDFTVKLGSWVPAKKIDFKGYGQGPSNYGNSDRSMIRDTTAGKFWRQIRESRAYPDNLIAPMYAWAWSQTDFSGWRSGALFSTEGFPCSLYLNGTFYGLFTFRLSKQNDNYLIDDKNSAHYLIQPNNADYVSKWLTFDSTGWSIYSPKIKKYDEGDNISSTAPNVQTAIQRLMTWLSGVYNSTIDPVITWRDYINLGGWIDYMIFCEVIGSADSTQNNVMLASYNAGSSSGIWDCFAYDLDETFGIQFGHNGQTTDPVSIGFVSVSGKNAFATLYPHFTQEIESRYADLRKSGVISMENISTLIANSTDLMDPTDYAQDVALWGTNDQASIAYILDWTSQRIAWLDAQWRYSE